MYSQGFPRTGRDSILERSRFRRANTLSALKRAPGWFLRENAKDVLSAPAATTFFFPSRKKRVSSALSLPIRVTGFCRHTPPQPAFRRSPRYRAASAQPRVSRCQPCHRTPTAWFPCACEKNCGTGPKLQDEKAPAGCPSASFPERRSGCARCAAASRDEQKRRAPPASQDARLQVQPTCSRQGSQHNQPGLNPRRQKRPPKSGTEKSRPAAPAATQPDG